MKRLHVNLATADLQKSISFYSALFGAEPTVEKEDYAKWMLDDPRVNLSLTSHGAKHGIDHLGIEAEDDSEFAELNERAVAASDTVFEQPDVTCCYARSTKAWVRDPDGVAWENFVSHDSSEIYGDGTSHTTRDASPDADSRKCCS